MTADIVVDAQHGMVYKILNNILHVPPESLTIKVFAALGLGHSWSKLPTMSTFVVEGVLDLTGGGANGEPFAGLRLCDGVKLSRIGLRLSGVRSITFGIGGNMTMNYGFGVFGDMHITVPASKKLLDFDFEIGEFGEFLQLVASLKGDMWRNAFGSGLDVRCLCRLQDLIIDVCLLQLEAVSLAVFLDLLQPRDSLTFDVRAELAVDETETTVILSGSYTVGGQYALEGIIRDFGVGGVVNFFGRHFEGQLSVPPDLDIHIGSASVSFSSDGGFKFEIDSLAFDSYTAEEAKIQMSSAGVVIDSKIADVKFPEVDIILLKQASIHIAFEKVNSQRSTDVALAGEIEVEGLNVTQISAAVHLYKAPGAERMDWTVYGKFTQLGDAPPLGSLIYSLRGTFLENISLQDLMFVAASNDDPVLSSMNPQKYHITKGQIWRSFRWTALLTFLSTGVQICAVLGEIAPFHKLMRRSTPGLTLSAGYSKANGLSLGVSVPADTMIHLGKGITTDPIARDVARK